MWRSKVVFPMSCGTGCWWPGKSSSPNVTPNETRSAGPTESSLWRSSLARHLRGPGRRSSSQGRQGLPCRAGGEGHPQRAQAEGPQLHQRSAGVYWVKTLQKWEVRIRGIKGIGGHFTEKAAAEAKALELVEKAGLQRQVKPVATLSELPVFCPKVPYPRVIWSQTEQQWHACCSVGGSTRSFRVRPKDHSEAELGAFLPSRCCVEEEAGEGEGEEREDHEVQGEGLGENQRKWVQKPRMPRYMAQFPTLRPYRQSSLHIMRRKKSRVFFFPSIHLQSQWKILFCTLELKS